MEDNWSHGSVGRTQCGSIDMGDEDVEVNIPADHEAHCHAANEMRLSHV
jgi:hypothetical protein